MVESDHGESVEDAKTTAMSVGGDADGKKIESVGKRPRDDSSEDESHELPSKKQRSLNNDRTSEPERDAIAEPMHKANGSSALKDDTMNVDEEEGTDGRAKITSAKPEEKIDAVDSSADKNIEEKARNDASVSNENAEQKKESVENKDGKKENTEKNDVNSEEKPDDEEEEEEDEEEEEEVDDVADSSIKEKVSVEKQPGKPSVSKSKTKDPEVVDGLEMSVECASDKEASSSEREEDDDGKKKVRPKTIIVKSKPNDSELDASESEGEKSEDIEEEDEEEEEEEEEKGDKRSKRATTKGGKSSPEGKGRKRGKKKGFTKVASSGSEDSDDNASEDEDYSPRTKKKMKKASPAKKTGTGKTPGKRRGRTPKKLIKQSDDEESDEQEENDDVNLDQRSKKSKEKNRKKASESEDEDKSEDDTSEVSRKNGKKRSKARPEDDRRIQALKKYFPMAGIPIKSYEQFWAGCKTNTARLARMKEALALHGVVGRPTMEKCKKAKARMELKKDVEELSPVGNLSEGRVTRARGGKKSTPPQADTPSRRESRGGNKRVSAVVDSESE